MTSQPFDSAADPADDADMRLDELALSYIMNSLTDEERRAVEARLAADDEALTAALKDWNSVVEELGLALPPQTPDPKILSSLLTRIGAASASTAHASRIADDSRPQAIVHRADGPGWRSVGRPGASIRVLNQDRTRGRMTLLMRIDAGCSFPEHPHPQDEECFVISGNVRDGDQVFHTGDYILSPAGSHHAELTTVEGCVCLITTAMPVRA